ncbi:MAG: hypothetical protein JWP31_434 [Aeromicrobium sp.]|nr:hypothetical protein [Aeromicrobium sp.]
MTRIDGAHALTSSIDVPLEELEDVDLLRLTREGSTEAYAALYDRYVYAARRLARHLGQREESDDVVSESFAQVLDLLQRGKGPDRAFRAYLFTTIRHESGRRAKANKRVMPTDDDAKIDTSVPFGDGELDNFEKTAIRAAYESLPERWRTVLWHLDVEGLKPNEIAPILGMKPNSVSALVYRARSGLRDAYLQQHVNATADAGSSQCDDVRGMLAAVVRRTATVRDQEKVHAHLEACEACIGVYLDLQEVNREVGSVALPIAAASVAAGGVGAASIGGGGAVVAQLFAGAKALTAMGVAAAGAAAVATVTVISVTTPSDVTAANLPTEAGQPAVSAPAASPVGSAGTASTTEGSAGIKAARGATVPTSGSVSRIASRSDSTALVGPGVTPSTVDLVPGAVRIAPDSVEIGDGQVAVPTQPVKDALERLAPETAGHLASLASAASN